MRIYLPLPPDNSELCQPVDPKDFDTMYDLIDGTRRAGTWRPISVSLIQYDEGARLLPSDAPWLGANALIFKRSAVDKLGQFLLQHGELLPLDCRDAELFVFNPSRIVDALDEDASTVLRLDNGRIFSIRRYAFRSNRLAGAVMFKIPNLRVSPTYVTDPFVTAWNQAALSGLTFEQTFGRTALVSTARFAC